MSVSLPLLKQILSIFLSHLSQRMIENYGEGIIFIYTFMHCAGHMTRLITIVKRQHSLAYYNYYYIIITIIFPALIFIQF